MKFKRLISAALAGTMVLSSLSILSVNAAEKLVAFPGAEGGGMYTQGARASKNLSVYHVTNLNPDGAGSFKEAVSGSNRIIVFDVSGTVMLKERLKITASNLTILGQTAPGEGICIGGEGVNITGSEIIMRYLRIRMGDLSTSQEDALGGTGGSNIIIDHCSVSWSEDEDFSFYAVKNFTAQYNIISESLNVSKHDKGAHGYGGIWGGENSSFHHNLIASHNSRTPRIGTSYTVKSYQNHPDTDSLVDIRNNVIYNWGSNSAYGGENGIRVNLVNNYYKPGPATGKKRNFYEHYAGEDNRATTLHVSGNVMEGNTAMTADNWTGINNTYYVWEKCESISDGIIVDGVLKPNDEYIYDYPITTETADEAYNDVLANAGANIIRDSVDERVINDVINGTAPTGSETGYGLIDSQDDVGGWPQLYGSAKTDTDGDGIPDEWEDSHGLDKNDSSDAVKLAASGYTNIEEYANDIAANSSDNKIDRSSLRNIIAEAEKLSEDDYPADIWADFIEVLERAKDILSDYHSTQADIDSMTDELAEKMSAMGNDYRVILGDLIAEAENIDKWYYTVSSYENLSAAITAAKAVLEMTEYDPAACVQTINSLRAAINNLVTSNRVSLYSLVKSNAVICPADIYADVWEEYINLTAEAEEACDSFEVDENTYTDYYNRLNGVINRLKGDYEDTVVSYADLESWENMVGRTIKSAFVGADGSLALKGAESTYMQNDYDNETIFIKYKNTADTGALGGRVFDFSGGESVVTSMDVYLMEEAEKYTGATIYELSNKSNKVFFKAEIDAPGHILMTAGEKTYGADFTIESLKWNRLSARINAETNTISFYINNDLIGEEISLPEDYGYVYNLYIRSNEYVGMDNIYFINRDYTDSVSTETTTESTTESTTETTTETTEETTAESTTEYSYTGDSDGNGALTANDAAVVLAKVINSSYTMPIEKQGYDKEAYTAMLDGDLDGELTAADAALILSKVLNSAFKIPAEN